MFFLSFFRSYLVGFPVSWGRGVGFDRGLSV